MNYKKIKIFGLAIVALTFMIIFVYVFCAGVPMLTYNGDNFELEAVAINSIPGVLQSDIEDRIVVLETDSYGRTLFVCKLTRVFTYINSTQNGVLAIIISQKTDLDTVCYYTEINYDLAFLDSYETPVTDELISSHFSEQDIEKLKEKNDWNNPFNSEHKSFVSLECSLEKNNDLTLKCRKSIENNIDRRCNISHYRNVKEDMIVYFVLNIDTKNKVTEYEWYFIVMDDEGNLPCDENSIHKVQNKENLSGEMIEFIEQINE